MQIKYLIAKRGVSEEVFFVNGLKFFVTNFLDKIQKGLLNKIFLEQCGIISVLRMFGIGFSAHTNKEILFLKIGLSTLTKVKIPKNLKICIKIDERKKPNIIWVFSNILTSVNFFTKTLQKYKPLSIFVRKRLTGILQIKELEQFRFKKWKDKRKKRK